MKISLMGGAVFAVFLLMMIPSVSAVEYRTVVDMNKTQLFEEINAVDITILKQKLKNIDNLVLQKKLKSVDCTSLKQNISDITLGNHIIDLEFLYLLFTQLLMTVLIGKPSLYRMFMNYLLVSMIVSEFVTGEPVPKCSSMHAGVVVNTIFVFVAYIYHQNKTLGFVLGLFIYLFITPVIFLAIVNYLDATYGHWTTS